MKGTFPINKFRELETPFYYYDANLLRDTLNVIRTEAAKYNKFCVHYAIKANANPKVLSIIREHGLGADCVSGGEIAAAIKAGFPASKIVYAGVGKTDREINLGLDHDICRVCSRTGSNQRAGSSKRKNCPSSFPHQSGCRRTYPCQYHHRTCREQVWYQHARHG